MKKLLLAGIILFAGFHAHAQKARMTQETLWKLGRVGGETLSPDGKTLYYGVTFYNLDENKGNRNLYSIPVSGGTARQLTTMEGAEYGMQFRPDGLKVGFIHGGQWWEMNPDGSGQVQVTNFEKGISNFKYSPDGSKVAFTMEVKMGTTAKEMYDQYPKANVKIIDDLMYRHWDHWEDEFRSHVFIANYADGKISNPVDIMEGEPYDCPLQPFGGSEDFVWDMKSSRLAYVCKKVTGLQAAKSTNSDIYIYSLDTKETFNLTKSNKGYDTHPKFSPDGLRIAWLSMKEPGYESDINRLKMAFPDGLQLTYIVPERNETINDFHWAANSRSFYLESGENATYQLYEAKINPDAEFEDNFRTITHGIHNVTGIIGVSGERLIASKTDMNHAAELYSFALSNGKEKKITKVNDKIYAGIAMSKIEKRMIKTVDGKDMLVWVIYPPNFDKNKVYPSLLYCQGGPQSAVSQFYSFRWNFQLMAANDYVVIAPNRRGLPTFGHEWNAQISGDWGGLAIKDYLSAAEAMKEEPFIHPEKMGAVGASYGGYSVYMLAGVHGDMFHSFVSHCGVFDLTSWYGTTEELFFANKDLGGPYWQYPTPKAYKEFSPHQYVSSWNTPILVIHGGRDFRVPINQGMEAFQAAKILGLKTRFLYFPEESHWVLSPQNGMIWHTEFFKWLDETLKLRE